MKTLIRWCALLALALPLVAHAGESKSKSAAKQPSPEEMQELMMKAGTPGSQHEWLRKMEGEWTQKVTYATDPSQPLQTSIATCSVRSIMGGRYTQEESTGEMMGMPFNGMGITGYDNVLKKFVSIWIDNMGTGLTVAEGQADAGGKVIRWTGQMSDPMTGKAEKMRMITTVVDDDNHTFELYGKGPDGKEAKMMTIEYARKKTSAGN